jgi:hypothetical protein
MPNVTPPSSGLGSNSNYFLNNSCNNLKGVSTTIAVSTDIVANAGFGFQLNAYSPKNETCAIQQYVISVDTSGQMTCIVNNWQNASKALINNWVSLYKLPSATLPAGYQCRINLQNDNSGNITAANFSVVSFGVAPAQGSALDAYWGSDSSQHVNFIGTDGHIHELYIHPGANWVNNDLTNFARAVPPAAGTAIDGYWGSDSSQHVNYVGTDGHIHELYIHPGAGWVDNNLTNFARAVPPAAGTALHAYWGSDSSQHVNYVGTDGHIHELYIHPGASWVDNNLTKFTNGVPPAGGTALTGYWGSDNSQHINYIGTDGHVHELYIHPGANWVDNNLTNFARAVLPVAGTAIDGYWGSDSSQHVNYIGTDGHVHELYIHPGANWVDNNLTNMARAVSPAAGSHLDAYWGTDSSQHINYLGTDGEVHELYIHPGANWVDNNLSNFAPGVRPAPGTKLDGYWGSDSSQHVNFIGTDGHIHELYIHPGASWINNDLTELVLANVTQTLTSISGVSTSDLAPIVAFELDFVGYDNGQSTTLSSGAGTITYVASAPMTVVNAEPSCCEFDGGTLETANTSYGQLPTGSSTSFVQTFSKAATIIKAPKRNGLRKARALAAVR